MNTITKQASRDILDKQIIGLNSLGLPLRTIGEKIGFHPTTVTQRLDALGVIDLRLDGDRKIKPRRMLIRMAERQEGQKHLIAEAQQTQ